jgi:hypothetical protein
MSMFTNKTQIITHIGGENIIDHILKYAKVQQDVYLDTMQHFSSSKLLRLLLSPLSQMWMYQQLTLKTSSKNVSMVIFSQHEDMMNELALAHPLDLSFIYRMMEEV